MLEIDGSVVNPFGLGTSITGLRSVAGVPPNPAC